MHRTQIQITEQQARKLRALAREQGISMSEVVRRCIDRQLGEEVPGRAELYARAAGLVGRFVDSAGAEDLSQEHDKYLDESYL